MPSKSSTYWGWQQKGGNEICKFFRALSNSWLCFCNSSLCSIITVKNCTRSCSGCFACTAMITSQPWGKWNYSLDDAHRSNCARSLRADLAGAHSTDANSPESTWKQKRATLDFSRSAQLISPLLFYTRSRVCGVSTAKSWSRETGLKFDPAGPSPRNIHNKYILRERAGPARKRDKLLTLLRESCQFLAGNSFWAQIGSWDCVFRRLMCD